MARYVTHGVQRKSTWGALVFDRLRARSVIGVAVLALILPGCEQPSAAPEAAEAPAAAVPSMQVVLTPEQVKHLALQFATIGAIDYAPQIQGFGFVVKFDELAQAESEVATAEAALRQSASALARAKQLNNDHYLSGEALDAAQKQAATDEAALALARRKQGVTFGRDAPWTTPAERRSVLASLSKGEKVLVRVTFPGDGLPDAVPVDVSVRRLGSAGELVKADVVWQAPADASVPGRSFFALMSGGALSEGERVLAFAGSGAKASGVLIPDAALVMSDGRMWCYIAQPKGVFGRRAVDTGRPLPGGYFASGGFRAGDVVVTQGQSLLLAYEMNPNGGEEE